MPTFDLTMKFQQNVGDTNNGYVTRDDIEKKQMLR